MTIQDTAQKFTKNFAGLELSPLYMLVKERKKEKKLSLTMSTEGVFSGPLLASSNTNKRDRHLSFFKSIHNLNLLSCLTPPLYT